MAGLDGRKRLLSGNRRGHGGDEGAGRSEMRFLGHGAVPPATPLARSLFRKLIANFGYIRPRDREAAFKRSGAKPPLSSPGLTGRIRPVLREVTIDRNRRS